MELNKERNGTVSFVSLSHHMVGAPDFCYFNGGVEYLCGTFVSTFIWVLLGGTINNLKTI